MKERLKWILAAFVIATLMVLIWVGPVMRIFMRNSTSDLDPQVRMFLGNGGNSLVLRSMDNQTILLVDTKMGQGAKKLKAYVDSLNKNAQVIIVNTHLHADHTGGNKLFPHARIIAGDYQDEAWRKQVGARMPDERIPVNTEKVITIGDETVRVFNVGQAHTMADMVVYLEKRKLLVTGDLVFNGWHPALFYDRGTRVGPWIKALAMLAERYPIKILLPGHGLITDQKALQAQQDYFVSIQAALADQARLAVLKKKYQGYFAVPGMLGFDQTVKQLQREKTELK